MSVLLKNLLKLSVKSIKKYQDPDILKKKKKMQFNCLEEVNSYLSKHHVGEELNAEAE